MIKKFLIVSLIVFIVAIAGCVEQQPIGTPNETKQPQITTQSNLTTPATQQPTNKTITTSTYSGTIIAGKSSPLIDFNKADYDVALKTDKLIVLYFYANWCPICRAEVPHLYGAFDELTTDRVIGFRVNYNDDQTDDNERNLAREFSVAYQHTKVFVKNGQRVLKSPETWDKNRYLSEINKFLT